MKVTPVTGPVMSQPGPSPQAQADAKARAVAILSGQQTPTSQNHSTPEERVTLKPTAVTPSITEPQIEGSEPEVKSEEPAKADPLSSQYAVLARKEKALRAKQQQQDVAFKQREEALKAKEAEIAAKGQEYESGYISKARLKERTLESLAEAGLTYEEITQKQIEAGEVHPSVKAHIERLEARLAAQEKSVEEGRRQATEQQSEAYKAAVNQIRQDAQALVKSDPAYEMIKTTNSVKDVVELIEATFKEEGRVMDVSEAADLVEQHLIEEIDKLTKTEKIKNRLNPKPATQELASTQPPTPKQTQSMKTLTNATGSTRTLSAKERAILAFKGELKE